MHYRWSLLCVLITENVYVLRNNPQNYRSRVLHLKFALCVNSKYFRFRLACFEVDAILMSNTQLTDHIYKHYYNQVKKVALFDGTPCSVVFIVILERIYWLLAYLSHIVPIFPALSVTVIVAKCWKALTL